MAKYQCSICGHIYDEEKGEPSVNIAPGTKWQDLPEDFTCPTCGAPKSVFELIEEKEKENDSIHQADEMKEYSNAELATIFFNFAKGAEKQFKKEEHEAFLSLANFFNMHDNNSADVNKISNLINEDISVNYKSARTIVEKNKDRGALRAITWSEKVSNLINSLINKYQFEGINFLEGNKIFVCEICGFIFIGKEPPEICPVCKVPKEKIHEVKGE